MSYDPIPFDEQVVGAKVVCFTSGGAGVRPSVRISTIEKVNAKTLRVKDEHDLFPRDDCERRGAGRWPDTRHVTLASSKTGQYHIFGMRTRIAEAKITEAYDLWRQAKGAVWNDYGTPRDRLIELRDTIHQALESAPAYVVDKTENEA